ncbi:MAG: hypothetical protein II208_00755 [Alphaproteobacteria bacterium]|nr:hypothetical protein [Alphaproteobacteria bacterium]
MKTMAIYFIATSNYKQGFEHFKRNLHLLYPDIKKTVVVLSDGLEEWDGVVENGITYRVFHIEHYVYPIIMLFKMKHILDHKIDCDYVAYLNGDLQVNPDFDFSQIDKLIDLSKFNTTRHAWRCGEIEVFDSYLFDKMFLNKNSVAYIDGLYAYAQSGFFIGPSEIVFKMCQDVHRMTELDLRKNIIPSYHDESYMNRWIQDNKDSGNIVYPPLKIINSHAGAEWPLVIEKTFEKDRWIELK